MSMQNTMDWKVELTYSSTSHSLRSICRVMTTKNVDDHAFVWTIRNFPQTIIKNLPNTILESEEFCAINDPNLRFSLFINDNAPLDSPFYGLKSLTIGKNNVTIVDIRIWIENDSGDKFGEYFSRLCLLLSHPSF